jgi:hypothetical protein
MPTRTMLIELLLVPIIAIFTQYDRLVEQIRYYDNPEGSDELKKIKARLDELCVKPFAEQFHGKTNIQNKAVSSECDI